MSAPAGQALALLAQVKPEALRPPAKQQTWPAPQETVAAPGALHETLGMRHAA